MSQHWTLACLNANYCRMMIDTSFTSSSAAMTGYTTDSWGIFARPKNRNPGMSSTLRTSTHTAVDSSPLSVIDRTNYPAFKAHWVSPEGNDPAKINTSRNSHLQVFGALLDPFTAVHAYSGFLRRTSLQLTSFTWQSAMSKMTAFFQLGPLFIRSDVPGYDHNSQVAEINDEKPCLGLFRFRRWERRTGVGCSRT